MEKRKTLVFAIVMIVMIAMTIAFTSCSATGVYRNITSRPTLTPDPIMTIPIDVTHRLELERELDIEQNVDPRTLPRKIPICVKEGKKELCPLGILGDVMYLGFNNGELMFGSTKAPYYVAALKYIQGQNYYLSTATILKDVLLEETTEILYYN